MSHTDDKIYITRKIREGYPDEEVLNLDRAALDLLALISRGKFISSADRGVNALLDQFLLFGLIVERQLGKDKRAFGTTANGVFALNQAITFGWVEGGE